MGFLHSKKRDGFSRSERVKGAKEQELVLRQAEVRT